MHWVGNAASLLFAGSSWMLFISNDYKIPSSWLQLSLHAKTTALTANQLIAIVSLFLSLGFILAFAGVEFVSSLREPSKDPNLIKLASHKGPSFGWKVFCAISSVFTVLYAFYSGYQGSIRFSQSSTWPDYLGLLCGLGSVAVAQVALVVYQFFRREWNNNDSVRVQLQEWRYPKTFIADVIHHLSNPGAFILMLPYLCFTWMFRLMPDSYYNYDIPVNWGTVFMQLLVVDFFTFIFHVAEHAFPIVYQLGHKPHHRYVNPQLFNAFDGSLTDTVLLILFPLYATANVIHANNWDYIAFGTVYSTHFMLIHSEYDHLFDPLLKFLFVNVCEDHHVHHATFNSNFSHFFTIFDRIAGTYRDGSTCKGFRSMSVKVE